MKTYSVTYYLLILMLSALGEPRSVHAQERYLYWIGATQAEETRGHTIFRYSLDSGGLDTLVQAKNLGPDKSRYFYHIAVDTLRQHIYWTDSGGTNSDGVVDIGAIMRASLEGDDPEVYLGGIVCGVGGPTDIKLDLIGESLYWGVGSDCPDGALNRADLKQSKPDQWRWLPTSGNYSVAAIALDIGSQMIYWTNNDFFEQEPHGILRAPINDTESDEYIVMGNICDIALAHTLSKIYWTPCGHRVIRRANFDGTEVEDVIVSEGAHARNLAIDHKEGQIYWSVPDEGKIRRANLDGTGVEDVVSGLVVPTSIALSFAGEVSTAVEAEEVSLQSIGTISTYPNPFSSSTTISYTLSEGSRVDIRVFDVLGREVKTLVRGYQSPGTQSVVFTGDGLPSGMYLYRLEVGGIIQTGAIQLIN